MHDAKRVQSRSTSTTASDLSEPKRARRNLQPDADLAEEAGSATRGPLKKQTSGTIGKAKDGPIRTLNRSQGPTRCKSASSGSSSSEPTGIAAKVRANSPQPERRRRALSESAKRASWTTEKEARTTRTTRRPSNDEYEEVPTAEETTHAWNSSDFRPTGAQLDQLSASGWLAEGRFDSTDDEDFLFVQTEAGEREDGRRPPNVPNQSGTHATGRHFYRISAKTMLEATEKGDGLTTEENKFKSRQWNLLTKLDVKEIEIERMTFWPNGDRTNLAVYGKVMAIECKPTEEFKPETVSDFTHEGRHYRVIRRKDASNVQTWASFLLKKGDEPVRWGGSLDRFEWSHSAKATVQVEPEHRPELPSKSKRRMARLARDEARNDGNGGSR